MKTDSGLPVSLPPSDQPSRQRTLGWPSTRLGWWSVGLAAAFVILMIFIVFMRWPETLEPFYGIFMMLCGLAAGIVGLIAVARRHERSWFVWLAILPGLFALVSILGEFLVPH